MRDEVRGIDVPSVSAWLEANVAGARGPFAFELIAGGRSNLTFTVTAADAMRYVLRRPPLGHVLATAHDMGREHRLIAAIGKTTVPVAPALGMCTDESVNGAPFYVMGYVDGAVLQCRADAEAVTPDVRRHAALAMMEVLAELHAVEPDTIGLGDLAKREDYLARQLRRWNGQLEQSKTRELPELVAVHEDLKAHMPPQRYTGIVHGDYRLGNCIASRDTGEIRAVLDWELCTLGDQLADLGYLFVYYTDPGSPWAKPDDLSGLEGFPRQADIIAHYAELTGRDLTDMDYYEAFSHWRVACILEGVNARYKAGVMGDDGFDVSTADRAVDDLAARAREALDRLG